MPRIHVHDFSFDYIKLENRIREDDFFCNVRVHYNFSPDDPGDGWDNLEYFFVSVCTPYGLAEYLRRCIDKGLYSKKFFFPNLLIVDKSGEDEIMGFIKSELHSIFGKTEKELILKAIRKFGWESENIPEVYDKLFK
ncbi:MAG: hypothetical protein KGZ74_07150 [Chitinophagaceae bacterium]|nr:hypothetical protein [Chitinophagaceae bacterium]